MIQVSQLRVRPCGVSTTRDSDMTRGNARMRLLFEECSVNVSYPILAQASVGGQTTRGKSSLARRPSTSNIMESPEALLNPMGLLANELISLPESFGQLIGLPNHQKSVMRGRRISSSPTETLP